MSVALADDPAISTFVDATGVSAAELRDFEQFEQLLAAWNERMNLVGPSASRDFWVRHALDSAQLFHVERNALLWADVGSGAGFPGIPLAILLKGRPGAVVHLIESMAKRVTFLRHVSEALALPVVIHHARVEDLKPLPRVDVVTARACAPLARLLGYTAGFFRMGARGLFLKGQSAQAEIEEARSAWDFRVESLPSRSGPSGAILRIDQVSRRAGA